jgi:hypothetical protein
MIVDRRTNTSCRRGACATSSRITRRGLPTQRQHLDSLVGFFTTEIGNVNEIVHIWASEDRADRIRRRAAMAADPACGSICRRAENI